MKQYILYGIGEILLVMIGILLALQVDNWNEDRTNRQIELQYYKNIKNQLNDDLGLLQGNIDYNNNYMLQYAFASQLIERQDKNQLDTLTRIALNLLKYSDFHRNTSVYDALVSSGEIKLLNNQHIIEALHNLDETYIYINKLEFTHSDVTKLYAFPMLNKIVNFKEMKIVNMSALFDYRFQNQLVAIMGLMTEKDEIYHKVLTEINTTINLIDTELNQ